MKRRTFLKAGAAGLVAAALPGHSNAASPIRLVAGTRNLDIGGRSASVFGLTGPDGRSGLILDQSDGFRVQLLNSLEEETLIHWHGLTPPWKQDGVPDMPQPMLKPGESRGYDFGLRHAGTNWMHAHTLQEQNLLAAPLVIRSGAEARADMQDVVMLLHDFSFRPAEELLASLTGGGGHAGMDHANMDHSGMDMEMDMEGMQSMAEQMSMPMDINDLEYDAYLANDRTLDDPEIVRVEKAGRIRLRIINAAASTGFTIDLGSLAGQLIAVDGQPVEPLSVRHIPLTMAQRADVLIDLPAGEGAYPVLALREGAPQRTGILLATAGAAIGKLETQGAEKGPVLDLKHEAGLKSATSLAERAPDRTFDIDLVGNMASYRWGLQGADRLAARQGERIEIAMTNQTMMAHPMHLHGHHFQIVAINGKRFRGATRDTVLIPPMQSVTIAFDADNPGKWAFHCHHLYHMVSGMMAFLPYEGI